MVATNGDREGSPVPIACSRVVLGLASAVMSSRSACCCLFICTASQICLDTVGPRGSTLSFCTNLFSTYCQKEEKKQFKGQTIFCATPQQQQTHADLCKFDHWSAPFCLNIAIFSHRQEY
jgi:hypothetical protein